MQHKWGMTIGMNIGLWWESQKESDNYEGQDVDGLIILKWILESKMGWCGLD
jgi:hypothetical protein